MKAGTGRSARRPARSSSGAELRRAAGEVLMVGLQGPALSAQEAAWLKLIRPGGVILFRRNLESAAGVHSLLGSIERIAAEDSPSLLRSIDVEGGTVDRLRDLIAPMPSPRAVAETGHPALFTAHGRLVGEELRLLGFNATLAPVLDLRTASSENVLDTRTVSGDPADVIRYARCFLNGLATQGVLGCGKHFPGLGAGTVDSHQLTPQISKKFPELWREDLLPYRRLAARLPMVMISHGAYPQTASGGEPASVSRFWASEVLVRKIGFRGLIVSDDMEMGGILSHTGLAEAALASLLAGLHLIEICHDPARVFTAYEALLHEAETSPAFARKLRSAASAVRSFRRARFSKAPFHETPKALAVDRMREAVQSFSEQVATAAQPARKVAHRA